MKKTRIALPLLLLVLLLLLILSVRTGYTSLSFRDILRILLGGGTDGENLVVFSFRMPRIFLGMLSGMGFALSGCVLQGLTRNPLADPGLLGINAGAGLVVVTFLSLAGTLSLGSVLSLPLFSLLGAALSGLLIYALSVRKNGGLDSMKMILNGIAIQLGMTAAMTLLALGLDSDQYEFVARFQAGSFWNADWPMVLSLLPWIAAGFLLLMTKTRVLNLLEAGDEIAVGLGVRVRGEKRTLMIAALALAAACVSSSGSMSFVGLVAPHLARRLVGSRHQYLVPASLLTGGIVVVAADAVARTVVQPETLPTGLVTSLIGAPYFLTMLVARRKGVR